VSCVLDVSTRLSVAGVETPLHDQLNAHGKQPALDLVLFTNGGDAEAPLRIVSLIREYCESFSLLVPHRALSAGTLLALGANEIVTTPFSVFGPIDPTRAHRLLPRREGATEPEPISVQDMRHAMQFIREAAPKEAAVAYTPEALAQIFTALFDKIHPLAIGQLSRVMRLRS
jgi:membrane-bound ClpP family serine protease